MSWQSTAWAVTLKPERLGDVGAAAHVTLCLLANRADERGRGAFYSVKTMAQMRGITQRTIRRHLEALEAGGLIRRGDQRLVQHVPGNRRPIVWDLCHRPIGEAPEDETGVTEMTPQPVDNPGSRGDKTVTPEPVRGDTHSTPGVTTGVTQVVTNTSLGKDTYLSTEAPAEFSTTDPFADAVVTRSDTDYSAGECIHGFSAGVQQLNRGRRQPWCPMCRRSGYITHLPEEKTHDQ